MVKLDVLVAGEPVDALSIIVHKEFAFERGKDLISRLRRLIPRQMFEVALQAAIATRSWPARTFPPCARTYWPSVRRRHLAQAQAAGKTEGSKKRMKRVGRVEIPQEAFLAVLKVGPLEEGE